MEINETEFDEIRPYYDSEVDGVIAKLLSESGFRKTVKYFFPDVPFEVTEKLLRNVHTIRDFQTQFIARLVNGLEKMYTAGVTFNGLENVPEGKGYLFVSNHRDIILDSAFLNTYLAQHGHQTSEIAIGSNLLIFPWITDLVKLNRTFVVKRNLSVKELMVSSMIQSKYIRHTIIDKKTSIWIAQREGRTKNGDDKTQGSVLKMFNMAASGDVLSSLAEMNIVPMTISYEYDPVDVYKVIEQYNKKINPEFKKNKVDDVAGMRNGLTCKKGRVNITLGKPVSEEILKMPKAPNKNIQYEEVAKFLDRKIYDGYVLYPINYVTADMLSGTKRYEDFYTKDDELSVRDYIEEQSKKFTGDIELQKKMLMEIYANPVFNKIGK
ncbi:MAG: 1-acyl-sn-glycerol-3-phosphate acyltransferase [Bacteroidales bacterium]|nr:1-acyl-sn-glycerol-3-phosphate acyltransferase [Bacteroidales bacterium]